MKQNTTSNTPATADTYKGYNGFDSIDDHEYVSDKLLMALAQTEYGDINEYLDTTEVRQEDGNIIVDLNGWVEYTANLARFREQAHNIFKGLRNGRWTDHCISLGYSIVDEVEDGKTPGDGRIYLSNDGATWHIPYTEEAILSELLEEAFNGIVEAFVKGNEQDIKDFFYDE